MTTTTEKRTLKRPAWLVLAMVEVRLIARNKTVATTAVVMPVGLVGLLMVTNSAPSAGTSGLHLVMLMAISVYMTMTLTLAHRRSSLYLKRIRSSPVSVPGILAGTVAAPAVLLVAQAVVLLVGQALVMGVVPQRPEILVVAISAGVVTSAALAFLTASFTHTPEAAQITTAPGFVILLGGALWGTLTPPDTLNWAALAVPGGGIAQLARYGFGEPGMGAMTGLVAPLVASAVVAVACCVVAARLFKWEPRA